MTAKAPDGNLCEDQDIHSNYNYCTSSGSRDFHCLFYNGKIDSFNHIRHIINSRFGLQKVTKCARVTHKKAENIVNSVNIVNSNPKEA